MALWIPRAGKTVDLSTPEKRAQSVQAVWRGFYARWEGPAAEVIQKWWRGHAARRFVAALREGRLLKHGIQERLEETAAVVIQRYWRGFLARRQAEERRKAIVDIQRWWKGYRTRKEWPRLRLQWRARNYYATDIQRWVRGHLARQLAKRLREEQRTAAGLPSPPPAPAAGAPAVGRADEDGREDEFLRLREAAATRIQAHWRGYQARKRRAWLRREAAKRRRYEQRLAAVKVIQAYYRGWYVRRAIARLRARGPLAPGSLTGGAVAAPGVAGDAHSTVVLPYGEYDDEKDTELHERPVPHGHPRPPPLPRTPSGCAVGGGGRAVGSGVVRAGGRRVTRIQFDASTAGSAPSTAPTRAASSPSRAAVQQPSSKRMAPPLATPAAATAVRQRGSGAAAGSALASIRAARAAGAVGTVNTSGKGLSRVGVATSFHGGGLSSAALSDPGAAPSPQQQSAPASSSRPGLCEGVGLEDPVIRPGSVPESSSKQDFSSLDPCRRRSAAEPLGDLDLRRRTCPDTTTVAAPPPGPLRERSTTATATATAATAGPLNLQRPSQLLLPASTRQRSQTSAPSPLPSPSPSVPPPVAAPAPLRALRQSASVPLLNRTSTSPAPATGNTATTSAAPAVRASSAGQQSPSPPSPDTPLGAAPRRAAGSALHGHGHGHGQRRGAIINRRERISSVCVGPKVFPEQLAPSLNSDTTEATTAGGGGVAGPSDLKNRPSIASDGNPVGGQRDAAPAACYTVRGCSSAGGGGGPVVCTASNAYKPEPLRSPSPIASRPSRSQGSIVSSRPQPLTTARHSPHKATSSRRSDLMRMSAPEPIRHGDAGGGGNGRSSEPHALSTVAEAPVGPRRQAWAPPAAGAPAPQTPQRTTTAAATEAAPPQPPSGSAQAVDAASNPLHDQVMRANRGGKVVNSSGGGAGKPAAAGRRRNAA